MFLFGRMRQSMARRVVAANSLAGSTPGRENTNAAPDRGESRSAERPRYRRGDLRSRPWFVRRTGAVYLAFTLYHATADTGSAAKMVLAVDQFPLLFSLLAFALMVKRKIPTEWAHPVAVTLVFSLLPTRPSRS
jgi:hypothetical protein